MLVLFLCAGMAAAQDRATGGLRGKVQVESGSTPAGIEVAVLHGDFEVRRATTNGKGEFEIAGLKPGNYELTFRKPGLRTGRLKDVEVRAGKTRKLSDKMYLPIDEGSIAFVRGSVFDPNGQSVRGAEVEIEQLRADGTARKLGTHLTTETGSFSFRLSPEPARYRVTARARGLSPVTKEVEVDGAAIFRVALTLEVAAR